MSLLPRDPDAADSWAGGWASGDGVDIGGFDQGTEFSRWALARYLVGHAVIDAVARGLLALAAVLIALCVVMARVAHAPFWAVLVALVALALLAARGVLRALLRRLLPGDADTARQLRALVSATRADVLAELRRNGLPGRSWTMPLLAVRLAGRHRSATMAKLRGFDVDRAVSRARLDAVHLLLRDATGRPDTLRP